MWVRDNFLADFYDFRRRCDRAEFGDVVSPVDHVTYPLINTELVELVRDEIGIKLSQMVNKPIAINYLFMRLSPAGVRCPHQAHTDATMGQYSAMLYLNYRIHCRRGSGTSILRHVSGMLDEHPTDAGAGALWAADCNKPGMWSEIGFCPMRPNRMFVFDSRLFHRAEPIGGFGTRPGNARLVLTAFFSEAA